MGGAYVLSLGEIVTSRGFIRFAWGYNLGVAMYNQALLACYWHVPGWTVVPSPVAVALPFLCLAVLSLWLYFVPE